MSEDHFYKVPWAAPTPKPLTIASQFLSARGARNDAETARKSGNVLRFHMPTKYFSVECLFLLIIEPT
jgi:hypothetical protein